MEKLTILIWIGLFAYFTSAAPYQERNLQSTNKKTGVKKDMFISRGWGAGGMPFSVLYMNSSFSSSKAPALEASVKQQQTVPKKPQNNKTFPQIRKSARQKTKTRSPNSVIPQLFLSYGWGPMGK